MALSESELLFYGGIVIMAAAGLLAAVSAAVFTVTGKKIRKKLEQEYGKARHKSA